MALIKTSDKVTDYVLPVKIKTDNGNLIYKNRYYSDEITLFKAYSQLKAIKGRVIPLYPVILENDPYKWLCT